MRRALSLERRQQASAFQLWSAEFHEASVRALAAGEKYIAIVFQRKQQEAARLARQHMGMKE